MKRFDHLFEKIHQPENLFNAFLKARQGKRKKPNVARFEARLEYKIYQLAEELSSQTYQPGEYKTFRIFDPKERMISAAPFRDRVVHHALCNIIEPIFDRTLIFDTYANRKGKGTHAGIRRCQEFSRKFSHVLKADIQKYFPSIDHDILKQIIRRKTKCKETLWLIDLIIDNSNRQEERSDYFEGDNLFSIIERRKGLPMGNLTSQFFANLYLSPLDHYIKEKLQIKGYVRYVDDFVIFHNDKKVLHKMARQIKRYCHEELRLLLHAKKTVVFPVKNGINFLGQKIFPTHRLLRKNNLQRFKKRTDQRLNIYKEGKLSSSKLEAQLNSWLGHAKQADTFRLRKKIFNNLRQEKGLNLFETDHFAWRLLEQQQ